MKYLGYFLLLLVFAASSSAWVARGNLHNPANPGKCTISDSVIIAPGATIKDPKQCAQIDCEDAKGNISIKGCGALGPPPNCEWGDMIDMHAPYPQCCERHLICKEAEKQTKRSAHLENPSKVLQTNALELESTQALNMNK